MAIAQSSLALLLLVAAASNGFSQADNLRQRNLGGTTISTNINTYTAYDEYASAMLMAVNTQRATNGLSPLCLNKKLYSAAQRHSNDMAAFDYMAHDGSDGTRMSQRITQAGYDWSSVAENVAAGQVDLNDVMVAWINSPEHLENIMGDYTMFGSAYAFNRDGTYQHYWTQEFGSGDAEECDGSALTYEDQVQVKGDTTVTDTLAPEAPVYEVYEALVPAPAPEAPAPVPEVPVTDAPVTLLPTTSTSPTDIPKDCESNF